MAHRKAVGIFVALSLVGLAALPATAQSAGASDRWKFELTPLFWASGLDVDAHTGEGDQSIDVSFSDILKTMHFGALGTFEVSKGRLGVLFDGMYVDLGKSIPQTGTMPGDVKLDLKQSGLSLAAVVRVAEGKTAVDLLGGVRYNYMDSILTVTSGPATGLQNESKDDWVDGFGGARLLVSLAKAWTVIGYADVGAGGSKLTWQARAGLSYRISKLLFAELGYRHQYFERETGEGGDSFEMAKSGFYIALGFRF